MLTDGNVEHELLTLFWSHVNMLWECFFKVDINNRFMRLVVNIFRSQKAGIGDIHLLS